MVIFSNRDAAEYSWQREQYALGVSDGVNGRNGRYADQYYQKGYRCGCARRKKAEATATNEVEGGERLVT